MEDAGKLIPPSQSFHETIYGDIRDAGAAWGY
jgi:hypothetical protein